MIPGLLYIKEPYLELDISSISITTDHGTVNPNIPNIDITIRLHHGLETIYNIFNDKNKLELFYNHNIFHGVFIKSMDIGNDGEISIEMHCDYHTIILDDSDDPDWLLYNRREKIIDKLIQHK